VDIAGEIRSFADAGIREVLLIGTGVDGVTGIPERIPAGMHVVFVLYEVREAFLGRAATDAASDRWRKAGATILPFTLLTPGIWTRVQLASSGQ
jgi:hypothetical protein